MTGHTKGPLVVDNGKRNMQSGVIKGGPVHTFTNGAGQSQLFMAMHGLEMSHEEVHANAERAVLCWNEHDRLVADLKAMTDGFLVLMTEYLSWNGSDAQEMKWKGVMLKHLETIDPNTEMLPLVQASVDVMSRRQCS